MNEMIKAARGIIKSDIVLKNGNIINVFSEQIIKADVAIFNDTIVGIGDYSGKTEIDCTSKYISPGFIDSHMHIESTMVMPLEFSKAVMSSGTTSVISDPHEIVNVLGKKGIDFMIRATDNIPLDVYVMLPSSVPATPFETNGFEFTHEDMEDVINNDRVLGLGEVMCFPDVIEGKSHILKKIAINKNKIIDGHAPNISGYDLQSYACAGVMTDHECSTFEEALEKINAGLKILVREGSAAKNCEDIIKPLVDSKISTENFLLCTDDKHLDDIRIEGHIRAVIKKAIDCGLEPIKAIKMATINAANTYNLKKVGAIAPGYKADIVVLDNLSDISVNKVFKDGQEVDDLFFNKFEGISIDKDILNTVNIKDISVEDIYLEAKDINDIIEVVSDQILTKHIKERLPKKYNKKSQTDIFEPDQVYNKLCVIERHRNTGNIKVAPLKGFNLKDAAIATTVAHDSHNIIVAGDNDSDIVLAVSEIKKIQGGYVITSKGKIIGRLELKVAGLLSIKGIKEVEENIKDMIKISRNLGIQEDVDPFLTLSFLSLPVIPEIRLTDKGLISINKKIEVIS